MAGLRTLSLFPPLPFGRLLLRLTKIGPNKPEMYNWNGKTAHYVGGGGGWRIHVTRPSWSKPVIPEKRSKNERKATYLSFFMKGLDFFKNIASITFSVRSRETIICLNMLWRHECRQACSNWLGLLELWKTDSTCWHIVQCSQGLVVRKSVNV